MEKKIVKEVWERVKKLREDGKLPPEPTQEELNDEPTAFGKFGVSFGRKSIHL